MCPPSATSSAGSGLLLPKVRTELDLRRLPLGRSVLPPPIDQAVRTPTLGLVLSNRPWHSLSLKKINPGRQRHAMIQPEHCSARILSADGRVASTGFLVRRDWLITCALVVEAACSSDEQYMQVTFLQMGIDEPRSARRFPGAWYPNIPPAGVQGMADIAILTLDALLVDRPPLFDPGNVTGVAADAYGYCIQEGQPAACAIDQAAGLGGWQYQSGGDHHHSIIEPDFSSAPLLWREHAVRIVGMIAQYHLGANNRQ